MADYDARPGSDKRLELSARSVEQVSLKPNKRFSDALGVFAEFYGRVGDSAVLQLQEAGELVSSQLVDAALDVLSENELQELLKSGPLP